MTAAAANTRFYLSLSLIGGLYVALIVAMLVGDLFYTTPDELLSALNSPEIRYAIRLSLVSCAVTTVLSLWVAVPLGYLLSRAHFPGKSIVDTIVDVPIVLPPLVIGLSLLILFQTAPGRWIEDVTERHTGFFLTFLALPLIVALIVWPLLTRMVRTGTAILYLPATMLVIALVLRYSGAGETLEPCLQQRFGTRITYQIPAVILAQFAVSCSFAVRTMRVTFDQISPRTEQVALTLGCTRGQAFWMVAIPESWRGVVTAGTIAWARSLGEFGPILIFAGATRMRTEVLSTTVFLELNIGHLEKAMSVSLLMILVAILTLLLMRGVGLRRGGQP